MQTILETPDAPAPLEKVALETYVPPAKPSLIGLSRAEIAERLAAIGVAPAQRRMRVQQLWHWIYVRGAKNFDDMTSISKEMRAQLEAHFTVARPEVAAEQISSDGTRKWLLRLPSGDSFEKAHEVECVYIPETDRGTLCVSSQVGCTLNCSFCTPARSGWCAISPQAKSSARSWWRAIASTTGPTAKRLPAAVSSPTR